MAGAEESLSVLQRFVSSYASDVAAVQAAVSSADQPEAARRVLVGALNYGLDVLDMFPDHYKGLGIADDAMILRLAAKQAVAAGASDMQLARLAGEAAEVTRIFAALAAPLETFVAQLPSRSVHGRSTTQILESKDDKAMFDGEINRQVKAYKPETIEVAVGGAETALGELTKMVRHALKKAGLAV